MSPRDMLAKLQAAGLPVKAVASAVDKQQAEDALAGKKVEPKANGSGGAQQQQHSAQRPGGTADSPRPLGTGDGPTVRQTRQSQQLRGQQQAPGQGKGPAEPGAPGGQGKRPGQRRPGSERRPGPAPRDRVPRQPGGGRPTRDSAWASARPAARRPAPRRHRLAGRAPRPRRPRRTRRPRRRSRRAASGAAAAVAGAGGATSRSRRRPRSTPTR